ncbi:Hypothetical predicted protein [Prunus dulcis]|uniref:Uncharacterized protein n=1 Tax=Prunus dulcis TaxID=3755 RepID=A0A5E4FT58_PRUDU|nr:hypothetical protein L3X38_020902 [Prunus dulcis]VVA30695.1 Hypothetical predicted protein [Prunus dulcis]
MKRHLTSWRNAAETCTYISSNNDRIEIQSEVKHERRYLKSGDLHKENKCIMEISEDVERKALQAKLDKMVKDLEEVRILNSPLSRGSAITVVSPETD